MTKENTSSKSIQSVETGNRVLEALAVSEHSLSLTDVAKASSLSPSQAHRYLTAHINTGMVARDLKNGRYKLGNKLIELGLNAYTRLDVSTVANQAIEELVELTNLSGLITVWSEWGPVIIRWVHGRPPMATTLGLGSVISLLNSSGGRVFLTYSPTQLTETVLRRELANRSTDEPDPVDICDQVRKRGYARLSDAVVPGLQAISAPILDKDGEAAAVLGLVHRSTFDFEHNGDITGDLLRVCAQASSHLGYNEDSSGTTKDFV